MATADITRKFQTNRNGEVEETKAYRLAKLLGDKRRKHPVTRQTVIDKLGFDPAPYILLYDCFEAVERGEYIYTGNALSEVG